MAKAIGIRVYLISIGPKGDRKRNTSFESEELHEHPSKFLRHFIDSNSDVNSLDEIERSWFFELNQKSKEFDLFGTINYGTFGFESNFKHNRTKKLNYRRKVHDVEEIPLYFQFYIPAAKNYAFAVFQSFQGRSCVQIVLEAMQERFAALNPDLVLRAKKLVPSDASGSVYNAAPVKSLRLVKRNTESDLSDLYRKGAVPDTVDVELTVSARRARSLGSFRAVASSVRHDGVITYGSMEFDQAVAQVRVGGKIRPVGIFGDHSNAGIIDITGSVVMGADGHPTLESVRKEAKAVLADFNATFSGRSR